MKKWIIKAVIQKAISFLPYKHQINFLFQKYITKGVQLSDDYFLDRLIHFQKHVAFYRQFRGAITGIKTLELGTGWYPVIPLSFYLCGAEKIYTVDIARLLNQDRLLTTIRKVVEYHHKGQLKQYLGTYDQNKMTQLEALVKQSTFDSTSILSQLNITYLVEDARQLSLNDQSIDLITSNNTFEHIYFQILKPILLEFKRVLNQAGLMSHFIDMSDHFAHLDQNITIYHFLQFSPKQWQWIDNSIQPQNRMRMADYRKLYRDLDLNILQEDHRPGSLEELAKVNVHYSFQGISNEEIAISHGYLVSEIEKN